MVHSAKDLVAALEKKDDDHPPPYSYAPSSSSHGHHANTSISSNNNGPVPYHPAQGYNLPPHPIKTFEIINAGFWTHKSLVLTYNGQMILWTNTKTNAWGWGPPEVRLCTDPQGRGVVAAAKCKNWSSGCRIFLGNPDGASKEMWSDVVSDGWTSSQYAFYFRGRKFLCKRTHDKSLGSSWSGSKDFKLVDCADEGRVLAVYLADKKLFSGAQVGRIDFMVELGQDLELMALAAILGLEEQIRRSEGATAGGAGGGGA